MLPAGEKLLGGLSSPVRALFTPHHTPKRLCPQTSHTSFPCRQLPSSPHPFLKVHEAPGLVALRSIKGEKATFRYIPLNQAGNDEHQPEDADPKSPWPWVCIREGFPEEKAFGLQVVE